MKFKDCHPEYKSYNSKNYYLNEIPMGFMSALEGFILRYAESGNDLRNICNELAQRIPYQATSNWGWDWLLQDLNDYLSRLSKVEFDKFMDFLSYLVLEYTTQQELNELLEQHSIGYYITKVPYDGVIWELCEDQASFIENIQEARVCVVDAYKQAGDHLEQAILQMSRSESERALKDAVRDCMSAMETLIKAITGTNDIKDGTKELRAKKNGPDIILKDGLSIWNKIHELYPDVRHGNPNVSSLSKEEASYWVDRICSFVKYISRTCR